MQEPSHQPAAARASRGGPVPAAKPVDRGNYPPTSKQLAALAILAQRAGTPAAKPRTVREASVLIRQLQTKLGQNTGRKPRTQRTPRASGSTAAPK